jgi:hypothetical protein
MFISLWLRKIIATEEQKNTVKTRAVAPQRLLNTKLVDQPSARGRDKMMRQATRPTAL